MSLWESGFGCQDCFAGGEWGSPMNGLVGFSGYSFSTFAEAAPENQELTGDLESNGFLMSGHDGCDFGGGTGCDYQNTFDRSWYSSNDFLPALVNPDEEKSRSEQEKYQILGCDHEDDRSIVIDGDTTNINNNNCSDVIDDRVLAITTPLPPPPGGPFDQGNRVSIRPLETPVTSAVSDPSTGIDYNKDEYSEMMRIMMMIREAKRQHPSMEEDDHTSSNLTANPCSDNASTGTDDHYYGNNYPMGFRFQPTDEELLVHYLGNKVSGLNPVPSHPMPEVHLYAHTPDELTQDYPLTRCATEWYFYTKRDKKDKNPNHNQPSRVTKDGLWESIGAIEEVHCKGKKDGVVVGYKRVLDYFYKKPDSKKVRSDWKMVEYMLTKDDDDPVDKTTTKLEKWVLCKIYENKRSTGQKRKRQHADG